MRNIRKQFPILDTKINQKPLIYFDNAATTHKPKSVIEEIVKFYEVANSNVHRSINPLAELATNLYEESRKKIAKFINASSYDEIIFTKNATESINLVAKTWGMSHLKRGDVVVLPISEHHSNIVPWLQLKRDIGIEIRYIPLNNSGALDMDEAKKILTLPNVKLLSMAYISNALGIIHPVEEMFAIAKKNKITTLIDAAQSVSHMITDVQRLDCDFLVFSGHKMYGPTGIGILYGKKDILKSIPEFLGGGEMIHEVFLDHFTTKEPPMKFEAGTPPIAEAISLGTVIDFINNLGFSEITKKENKLASYLFSECNKLPFLKIYGNQDMNSHIPIIAFSIDGIHAHDIADILGEYGICIRAGHHCAMPLHNVLGVGATARASLCFYNTQDEINSFIDILKIIYKKFR